MATATSGGGENAVLALDFSTAINVSYQPGAERRFSLHVYLSRRLGATAIRSSTADRHGAHCCHHSAPSVHVVHLPDVIHAEQAGAVDVVDVGVGEEGAAAGVLKLQVSLSGLRWRLTRQAFNASLTESTLNFDLFDHIRNSSGEDCFNQVGCARVPLVELMARQYTADVMRYELIVPGLRIKHYSKGVLSVLPASSSRVLVDGVPSVIEARDKQLLETLSKRSLQVNTTLFEEHMLRWIDFFQSQQVVTRYACTEGINVWRYDSRVGVEPFEAYIGSPLPPANLQYYEQALDIVLARYGVTQSQWLERANLDSPQRDSFADRVLCEVITLFVCVCNYVPDEVYANASSIGKGKGKRVVLMTEMIESFDFCRVRRALDCEDSALEINYEFYELHKLYQEQFSCMSAALRRLVEVAHCYHSTLWLVGVSGAEINEERIQDVESMDAHMHVALVPKAMWVEWCRRGRVPLNDEQVMPLHSADWGDTPQAYERSKRCRGVMINEGTGFLEPTGDDDTLDMRTILYKLMQQACGPAFDLARKVYGFKRGQPSGFYKLLVGVYTPAFLLRGGTACGFVPCQRDDLRKYVVRFQDVTADAERQVIAMRMLPTIRAETWQEVQRASADLYPVGPLEHASLESTEHDSPWLHTARENIQSCERALRRLAVVSTRNAATLSVSSSSSMSMSLPVVYHIKYEACTVDALQALVNGATQLFKQPQQQQEESATTMINVSTGDDGSPPRQVAFAFSLASVRVSEERVSPDLGAFRVELNVVATALSHH